MMLKVVDATSNEFMLNFAVNFVALRLSSMLI